MKNLTLNQNLVNEVKSFLGINLETQITVRNIRKELFNLDNQEATIVEGLTVREARSLFFDLDNQEAFVNELSF